MGQSKPLKTSRAEQYRRRAEELRDMAKRTRMDENRLTLEHMARQYERLASDAARSTS